MSEVNEGSAPDDLKQAVDRVADDLLARGIRPTLAQVEAEVAGPRGRIIWLLEDWALRVATHGQQSLDDKSQPSREAFNTAARHQHVKNMAVDSIAAGQAAAREREAARRTSDRAELISEIDRARERLSKLEASKSTDAGTEARAASILKLRQRLQALEARLKMEQEAEQPHSD